MNWRRLIATPESQIGPSYRITEQRWKGAISALGQKQTYALQKVMSAVTPVAIDSVFRHSP
jgi:hypothetical protein